MQLRYSLEEIQASRGRFGLVVLQTDETIERDFRTLGLSDDLWLYHSRIPSGHDVTVETLSRMEQALPAAASLLPKAAGLQVVGYACTSGATVLGEAKVEALVRTVLPGVRVTNPMTALKAACRALGVRRLGLVSPYEAEVSDALCATLAASGIEVTAFAGFGEKEDWKVARIDLPSILEAMVQVGGDVDCDAVFASCTNLRALEIIEEAEALIDKPALCSNQVLAWHMLRLADIPDRLIGGGRLFSQPELQARL